MGKLLARLVCCAALAFSSAQYAYSETDEAAVVAFQEVTSELQVCSAYYDVASRCLASGDPRLSARYAKSSIRLESLAHKGKLYVSDNGFNAQSILFFSVLMSTTDNSCGNLPVLIERYESFCRRLEGGVDARFKEWVKCVHNGQNDCGGPELP
jgi:hypothetical protein